VSHEARTAVANAARLFRKEARLKEQKATKMLNAWYEVEQCVFLDPVKACPTLAVIPDDLDHEDKDPSGAT
jgi:hypothetical protein